MPDTQVAPNTDDKISALEALVTNLATQVAGIVKQNAVRADSAAAKADEDEDDDKARDDAAERSDEKAKKDAARDALFGGKRKDAKRSDEDDDEDDEKKEKKDAAKADEDKDEDEDEDDKKKRDDNDEPEPMASDDRRKDRQKADAARDDEKRDDEDKDEDKEKEDRKDAAARADSRKISALEAQLAQLQRSMRRPRPQTDDELNALAERQQEWDRVAQMFGQRASRPLDGERIESYDRRVAKQYQKHSKKWGTTDLAAMPIEVVNAVIAPEIRADAIAAAYQVEPTTGGMLREIRRPDRTGRIISEFVGPVDAPNGALAPFRMPSAAVRRINTQPNQY